MVMVRTSVLGILLLLCASAFGAHNQLSQAEQAEGWQLLFDGKSLDEWRTYNQPEADPRWKIEDSAIVLTARGGGDLITRQAFEDFELSLEWKVARKGNSGIFFHADESELPIFVHAPEIQILDNERHPDRKQEDRRAGALYDMIAVPSEAQRPAEQWNQVTIKLVNGLLSVSQNGIDAYTIQLRSERWDALVKQSKFKDWPGFGENTSGHIGLQDHGDRVWFRNIKIRNLNQQAE